MSKGDFTMGSVLSDSWGKVKVDMGNNLIISLIFWAMNYFLSGVWIIIGGPMSYGFYGAMLDAQRGKKPEIGRLFSGFSLFLTTFLALIIVGIFVLIWTLPFMILLIIPGIITMILAILRYSMTFLVLNDNPEMKPNQARKRSVEITKGHKGKIFIYMIISIIPVFGTMVFGAAMANLYDRVK
ncbi:MAG: hypothetical protein ACMUIG_02090 [Thermoplasmatota archaeon]